MSDDFAPRRNADYATKEYWDERFHKEEQHEWLVAYEDVKKHLAELAAKTDAILLIGCGNSGFSAAMRGAGYENIVSTDYSEIVIERMRAKHPDMCWEVADMRALPYAPACFDVVIDKAGLDATMVRSPVLGTLRPHLNAAPREQAGEGSVWDPVPEVVQAAHETCLSVLHVLKPGGRFVSISFQQPHFRKRYFGREEYSWAVQHFTLDVGFGYFVYVATKEVSGASGYERECKEAARSGKGRASAAEVSAEAEAKRADES